MKKVGTLVLALQVAVAAEAQTVQHDRLVTIEVAADASQGVSQQTIEIVTDRPFRNISEADLEHRVWTARRVLGSRTDAIDSNTCPELQAVALSFANLPPLPIRPMASFVGANLPIGPMMKDGYSTSLTFDTLGPDFASVTVQLDGWGPYHQWGHQAVTDLLVCWSKVDPSLPKARFPSLAEVYSVRFWATELRWAALSCRTSAGAAFKLAAAEA